MLVLDDLTPRQSSPWDQEKLLQTVNHRHTRHLPTVVTGRGPLEGLSEPLLARLASERGIAQLHRLDPDIPSLPRGAVELPAEMADRMTFANFDLQGWTGATKEDRATLDHALEAVETFAHTPEGWLLLASPHGVGKAHLAVAATALSRREGRGTFYSVVPALLDLLRSAFNPDSPLPCDELMERVKKVPLLTLDDLGSETATPWAEEKLHQIIVHRHDLRLPTIITAVETIGDLEEAKPRIGSRLLDDFVHWVLIEAPNYRTRKPSPAHEMQASRRRNAGQSHRERRDRSGKPQSTVRGNHPPERHFKIPDPAAAAPD